MISLPPSFEERMKQLLQTEASSFFQALQSEPPVSIRFNPAKHIQAPSTEVQYPGKAVDWCPEGKYLNKRPIFTLDPCFHGGAYYVQEASSMFLSHIFRQIQPEHPLKVLDLCAAPGGKTTLLASLLPAHSMIVANEVIRSRAAILKENLIKWGTVNAVVTNNDPADFSDFKGYFDIILVDAPCSGEGMFRKDPNAITEWSGNNLQLCSERQRRILSDIWECLRPEGYLIYSTCTYNPTENEANIEWLLKHFSCQPVFIEHSFNTITPGYSSAPCYRFYPHQTQGEGFFIGVVQKADGEEARTLKSKKTNRPSKISLPPPVQEMLQTPEYLSAYMEESTVGFLPAESEEFISTAAQRLRILYKGCEAAEFHGKKIRFLPPLALSQQLLPEACHRYEMELPVALSYLKKEDIPAIPGRGEWLLMTYQGIALGWSKNLGNRLNNYYPKEWRIRMDIK